MIDGRFGSEVTEEMESGQSIQESESRMHCSSTRCIKAENKKESKIAIRIKC